MARERNGDLSITPAADASRFLCHERDDGGDDGAAIALPSSRLNRAPLQWRRTTRRRVVPRHRQRDASVHEPFVANPIVRELVAGRANAIVSGSCAFRARSWSQALQGRCRGVRSAPSDGIELAAQDSHGQD